MALAYAWGAGSAGQLGIDKSVEDISLPTAMSLNIPLKWIGGGGYHSLGLDHEGRLWTWVCVIFFFFEFV